MKDVKVSSLRVLSLLEDRRACDATEWMSVATQEKKWMNEEEMTVFIEYKQRQWRQQMIKREKTILSIW